MIRQYLLTLMNKGSIIKWYKNVYSDYMSTQNERREYENAKKTQANAKRMYG